MGIAFCAIGGILVSLITNAPVGVFVTTLSFVAYLVARFAVGPALQRGAPRGAAIEGP